MAGKDPKIRGVRPMDEDGGKPVPSKRGRGKTPKQMAKDAAKNGLDTAKAAADTGAGALGRGVQGALGYISGIPGKIRNVANGTVGGVAQSFGVSKTAAGIGIATIGGLGGLGVATAVVNNASMDRIYRQEAYVDDCGSMLYDESKVNRETSALEGDEMYYAEMMYGVLANLGFSATQCAGAVSSMTAESGMDPTAFEGIYDERYQIGAKKSQYVDGNSFTPSINSWFYRLKSMYAASGIRISDSGYDGTDGNKTCGIGLLQFTGPAANNVMNMAEGAGKMWYDCDVQLAYMLSDQSGFGARIQKYAEVTGGLGSSSADAATCADAWTKYVEMGGGSISASMMAAHRQKAAEIVAALGSRHEALISEYADMADEVLAMAGSTFDAATAKRSGEVDEMCGDGGEDNGLDGIYDNTGMARLFTYFSYQEAHGAEAKATGGNPQKRGGTKMYQELRDESLSPALRNDPYWNSCDRGVATAVISAGADDDFPLGACCVQLAYLEGSDKWEKVGALAECKDRLEPGDVIIYSTGAKGHVLMYTSTELNSAEGGPGEICSASYGQRYPGMGSTRNDYGDHNYTVFRHTSGFDGAYAFDLSTLKSPIDHH